MSIKFWRKIKRDQVRRLKLLWTSQAKNFQFSKPSLFFLLCADHPDLQSCNTNHNSDRGGHIYRIHYPESRLWTMCTEICPRLVQRPWNQPRQSQGHLVARSNWQADEQQSHYNFHQANSTKRHLTQKVLWSYSRKSRITFNNTFIVIT